MIFRTKIAKYLPVDVAEFNVWEVWVVGADSVLESTLTLHFFMYINVAFT